MRQSSCKNIILRHSLTKMEAMLLDQEDLLEVEMAGKSSLHL